MRKKLLLFTAVVMAALVMVLSGCGSSADKGSASGDKKNIKLGVRADGAERAELLRAPLEKMGYTLEIIPFEDSILPNVALGEKSIDVNWYQHLPLQQIQGNGFCYGKALYTLCTIRIVF